MILRERCSIKSKKDDNIEPQSHMVHTNNIVEPSSFNEAINSAEAAQWFGAMNEEIESLKKHNTWSLVVKPPNANVIKCKWVFKRKTVGETERFKARLVAKGFSQKKGVHYEEVYAPVSGFDTLRLLVAIGVEKKWFMDQYDVKSAYLHSDLKETLYMEQPEGFIQRGKEKLVCKLNKSIYGLKQSGRCWNEHLNKTLESLGFVRNKVDPCVYQLKKGNGKAILAVYVDDLLVLTENESMRSSVKELLERCFDIKYLGTISHLLGVKFNKKENGSITLSQEGYVNKLLNEFGLQDAKGIKTPMEQRPEFLDECNEDDLKNLPYRELIGGLLYLSQRTRPDIAFSVGKLAQYCSQFNKCHWNAAKRVLRYLKETQDYGITYHPTNESLVAYADTDWSSCTKTRKSISGYVLILAGAPIIWKSSKQTVIALSTMEAEYVALAACAREVFWVKELLKSLDFQEISDSATTIWCDSEAAIAHARNYVDKSRTKHIAIRHHFVREKVMDGTVELRYVPSEQNVADIFTKALCNRLHESHRSQLVEQVQVA